MLSARKSRTTSAPVIVGPNIYLTRRADNGKGPAAECVAGLDRGGQAKFNGAAKEAHYLDANVQRLSKQKKAAGMQLDAANGFAGGTQGQANPQAAAMNVGQDNVSTMQAFQGSRMLHFAGKNFNCMGDEVVSTDPTTGENNSGSKRSLAISRTARWAAPPGLAGGHLFIATLSGEIWQMEAGKGEIKVKFKLGQAIRFQPAIDAGWRIYVGTQNGQVICINTGDAGLTGWPCWGANAAITGVASKVTAGSNSYATCCRGTSGRSRPGRAAHKEEERTAPSAQQAPLGSTTAACLSLGVAFPPARCPHRGNLRLYWAALTPDPYKPQVSPKSCRHLSSERIRPMSIHWPRTNGWRGVQRCSIGAGIY